MKKTNKNLYAKWVNYKSLDPVKKLAQDSAKKTSKHLTGTFCEISESRGESAFIWKQGKQFMASVLECLGTKNLVADEMAKHGKKSYYDVIAYDTVAASINDLSASGAKPLIIHAFWALWNDDWLLNKRRTNDFVQGWNNACDDAYVTWGGGETPSLTNVISKNSVVLASSVVGIFKSEKAILKGQRLKIGDRIILIKSNGINANGISLVRDVAKKLPQGYATKIKNGKMYGEAILTKTNIYAKVVNDLNDAKVGIHYISNITGHGLRKIMRAPLNYTYTIEKLFKPQALFLFIQKKANLSDYEMYETFNMGQDYALYLPSKDVKKTLDIIKKNKFLAIDAGYVSKGPRQVVIKPKNITFSADTLNLR